MKINFKNFGILEALVILSSFYVVGMLLWTASTRPAVEAKANQVTENHKKIVGINYNSGPSVLSGAGSLFIPFGQNISIVFSSIFFQKNEPIFLIGLIKVNS